MKKEYAKPMISLHEIECPIRCEDLSTGTGTAGWTNIDGSGWDVFN